MKTKLQFINKNSFLFLSFLLSVLCVNIGWSQQVIGEFPAMDGGLENQTAGNLSSQGSGDIGVASTTWSISTTGGTTDEQILSTPADARTGNYSAQAQLNSDKTNARLQTPSTVAPNAMAISTSYTVQFFYKSPEAIADADLKPGIYLNNTQSGKTTNKTDPNGFAINTWVKTYGTVTTGSTYNMSNWAVARIGGDGSSANPLIHFDDFVVYAGAYDDTAPDAATSGTHSESGGTATVGWTAPAGGVDGGGYVVFKYASEPAADNDPNQNGIYEVGNTTTNGTASLEGTVVYIGTDTSFNDTYVSGSYYKVYAVDKAFNYSSEITISAGGEVEVEAPGEVVAGQVIGEFPTMDGGLENQTIADPMTTVSSSGTTTYTNWSIGSSSAASSRKIVSGEARTGNVSGVHALALTKTNSRYQSPTNPSSNYLLQDTDYVIQYFYRAAEDPRNNMRASIYMNGTSDGENSSYQDDTSTFVPNVWVKYAESLTTDNVATAPFTQGPGNYACMRLDGDGTNFNEKEVDMDDFVVYAGSTVDETAPNAPTTATYVNNSGTATIGWTAPAGGVDGGGYVVIKYASAPNADNDPNQNGIYNVGNTTTNGTGGLLGTVAYIGTVTSFNDTYTTGNHYKVYAVDKAFNYSDELVVSDDSLGAEEEALLSTELSIYPNPASDYITINSGDVSISNVTLYNLLGNKIISQDKLQNNQLDVSNVSKGVYILRINTEKGSLNQRIMIR